MASENIEQTLRELRKYYASEREKLNDIGQLVREAVDREIVTDFWELSNGEIEREMWQRLEILDADADCLPGGPITSHRPLLGKPLVWLKKVMRFLTAPYSSMLLQKQNRLNRELVTFQLLTFLKFRHLDGRLREIEEKMADLPERPRPEDGSGQKPAGKK